MNTMPAVKNLPDNADIDLDEALVTDARNGDENAVRRIIRMNNQRLFRAARLIVGDDSEAEDVVQESYVRAFTRLSTFRGDARLSTWLMRIAINEALGRLRVRRAQTDFSDMSITDGHGAEIVLFPLPQALSDPETEMARTQTRILLERAVDALPLAFRSVFVLRDVEGMSTEETASQLALKPETVKTRLHRARNLMRHVLQEQCADAFTALFPFDGARCIAMAERVLGRLHGAIAARMC